MDWRLAMARAAALFQRDLAMRKVDCLTGGTHCLAPQRPHPDENLSGLVVQRVTASRIVVASALVFVSLSVWPLVLVLPSVSAMVMASPLAKATALVSVLA